MSGDQKVMLIPIGFFEGAVGSLEVSDSQIIFHRKDMDESISVDWNGEAGTFQNPDGLGTINISVDSEMQTNRVRVDPKETNPSFPRVGKTDFFFMKGKYDGDGNEITNYVIKKKKILHEKRRE